MNQTCDLCGAPFGEDHRKGCPLARPMTDTPAPVTQPLVYRLRQCDRCFGFRGYYTGDPEGEKPHAECGGTLTLVDLRDAARSVPDNAAPPDDPIPLHEETTRPRRSFNLRNNADFAWLADYFSGYHGVPGLRAAAVPDNAALPWQTDMSPADFAVALAEARSVPDNATLREAIARLAVGDPEYPLSRVLSLAPASPAGLDDAMDALRYAIDRLPPSGSRMTQAAERRIAEAFALVDEALASPEEASHD